MHFGKWSDLFYTYQKVHDFGNKPFNQGKEEKENDRSVHSLMEL